jgi:hypothetical protein
MLFFSSLFHNIGFPRNFRSWKVQTWAGVMLLKIPPLAYTYVRDIGPLATSTLMKQAGNISKTFTFNGTLTFLIAIEHSNAILSSSVIERPVVRM